MKAVVLCLTLLFVTVYSQACGTRTDCGDDVCNVGEQVLCESGQCACGKSISSPCVHSTDCPRCDSPSRHQGHCVSHQCHCVIYTVITTPAPITKAPSTSCSYQLKDGSFETGVGWIPYGKGFMMQSTSGAEDGTFYITVIDGGAEIDISFDQSAVHNFTLSGYSRPRSSVTVFDAEDYSIYCDLEHPDGTYTWGMMAPFNPNGQPYNWQEVTLHVSTAMQIVVARCYAMFRNGSGSVDFDKFKLESCS